MRQNEPDGPVPWHFVNAQKRFATTVGDCALFLVSKPGQYWRMIVLHHSRPSSKVIAVVFSESVRYYAIKKTKMCEQNLRHRKKFWWSKDYGLLNCTVCRWCITKGRMRRKILLPCGFSFHSPETCSKKHLGKGTMPFILHTSMYDPCQIANRLLQRNWRIP